MADRLAEPVDVRLASAGVAFGAPFSQVGTHGGMAVSWLLPEAKAGLAQRSPDGFEAALQWEALAQPVTMATADIHRGIQARREHRSPTFEGS